MGQQVAQGLLHLLLVLPSYLPEAEGHPAAPDKASRKRDFMAAKGSQVWIQGNTFTFKAREMWEPQG